MSNLNVHVKWSERADDGGIISIKVYLGGTNILGHIIYVNGGQGSPKWKLEAHL